VGQREVTPVAAPRAGPPADAATVPKLALEDVSFSYGEGDALTSLELDVRAGEFVSLLGPSGCGKTTALRIVAGLLRPSRGRVLLDGRDITRLAPERRPLGMVFQHLALFPHLSVAENVGFSLSLRRVPKREVATRTQAMLDLVGLGWAGSRSVQQLSGGQQQRVALARSLISEPEILLLDEPLGALDLQIRKEMQAELKNLQRRVGITFIFVTHDQNEAMAMSDRIVLMRNGRIVQDAPPPDVYAEPVDAFAAGFVGETNLLAGTVRAAGPDLVVGIGEAELALPADPRFGPGDAVVVSIRPEHLALAEPGGIDAVADGAVVAASFLGYETLFEVETAMGRLRVRWISRDDAPPVGEGDHVALTCTADRVRVFPVGEPA
jgi:ABC-type Fe3+/spermidine/putrescine transport system ATPase subunit